MFFWQAGAGGQKYVLRDLMRVLEQEKHAYTDPVTEVCIIAAREMYLFLFSSFVRILTEAILGWSFVFSPLNLLDWKLVLSV